MVIVLMGVAGSGKTTLGRRLAEELGWSFADADRFHPAANISKMSAGLPLDDDDRAPWLAAIRSYIQHQLASGGNAVVTCSALKERYRQALGAAQPGVKLVYLKGSREVLWSRISARSGHFMKSDMLDGQLAALEEPADALVVGIAAAPDPIVAEIRRSLDL
ncbi:MAG: carbohydrate kinase, thermoresistant glucokinase family [Verrucomicrobia bacterium]|nr:carbohydrate kinase, thermoresistant glucokinase family [Verrucomicrobiota bacterium]